MRGHSSRRRAAALSLAACLLLGSMSQALETDQYFTWGLPLADSTDVMNAKVNAELLIGLRKINNRRSHHRLGCEAALTRLAARFRMLIFHPIELWANNSSLVSRIPRTAEEELAYRKQSLYGRGRVIDPASWLPPSPTIQLNEVRVGTDKMAHFFSGGRAYYTFYQRAIGWGLDEEEALNRVIDRGIFSEKTYLGKTTSGVFSGADLEANYQGLQFWTGMCGGDDPMLVQEEDGWQLSRPFDFRDWVTVEWDESYNTPGYSGLRWRRVRPVLLRYCSRIDDDAVRRQRREYALRDSETRTERRLRELRESGALERVERFSLENACAEAASP